MDTLVKERKNKHATYKRRYGPIYVKDSCFIGLEFIFNSNSTVAIDTTCKRKHFTNPKNMAISGNLMTIADDTSYIIKADKNVLIIKKYSPLPGWRANVKKYTMFMIFKSVNIPTLTEQQCNIPEIEHLTNNE